MALGFAPKKKRIAIGGISNGDFSVCVDLALLSRHLSKQSITELILLGNGSKSGPQIAALHPLSLHIFKYLHHAS